MRMKPDQLIELWVAGKDYPDWMDEAALLTLTAGYLLPSETPKDAMRRISKTAAEILNKEELEEEFFNAIWLGWLCPSTPVWANFGSNRGLPISCFGSYIDDSISGIFETLSEVAMMSKLGGGTSVYAGGIRGRGSKIGKSQGKTNGTQPFLEIYDKAITKVSQGSTRRGALAAYLDITHKDIDEHLQIKEVGAPIQNLFGGVCIPNNFIDDLYNNDDKAWTIWAKVLESRNKTGLPYLFFNDNVNAHKTTPEWYGYHQRHKDFYIKSSNLCTEIMLPCNNFWSFVCCLISVNLAKWEEWRYSNVVELGIYLLDAIMEEFIEKTEVIKELKKARNFAKDNRALGLGVLGWHTLLQTKDLPFLGIQANSLTRIIFDQINNQSEEATLKLVTDFGLEPSKIGDGKRRNSTRLAIAPTVTNATIQDCSPGTDCIPSNYFIQKSAKGDFVRKNKALESLLMELGKNTDEVWDSIKKNGGSVQHLEWLPEHKKEVFKTFKEINQFGIIEQAALRQNYLDQGQSLNVNIPPDTDPALVSKLYLYAHDLGVKTLYYQRSETILRGGLQQMAAEACVSCAG